MTKSSQPTVRSLARRLGVTHGALQKAAARGALVGGVGRDARGRLVVLDADLAAQEWKSSRSRPTPARPPGRAPQLDVEGIVFALLEYVLTRYARECVLEWDGVLPVRFDPETLLSWLAAHGPGGEKPINGAATRQEETT